MSDLRHAVKAVERIANSSRLYRDSHEDLAAVIAAARLVASGEVIPRTDLHEWHVCEVHQSRVRVGPGGRPGDERCERAELHLAFEASVAVRACRIVDAGLYLPGEKE